MTKKTLCRSLALAALAFFFIALTALAESAPDPTQAPTPSPTPAPVNATDAAISAAARTLEPGEAFSLCLVQFFPQNMDEPLLWRTSDARVISITETDGRKPTVVAARTNGRATVSLIGSRSGRTLARCQVTVRTVKITSMAVSPKTLTIAPELEYTLSAKISPSNATYKSVTWTTPDRNIVSFDKAGDLATVTMTSDHSVRVYARNPGKVVLTAVTDTGRRATCAVTVKALAVSSVKFPKSELTVFLKDANLKPLTAVVSPANTGFTPEYKSLNPEVADIDPVAGVLTLKNIAGQATIMATAGGKTGYCRLTVASAAIKSLSVSTPGGEAVILNPGETARLTAVASPAYAADTGVTWESDRPEVAAVTDDGLVKAVSGGFARITATSAVSPKIKASISVHVRGSGAYRTVTITAAGDCVLGGDQRVGKVVANPQSYQAFKAMVDSLGGDSQVFEKVKDFFGGDKDVSTLNLEGTLTLKDTRHDKKPFVFQGRPEWARTMLKAAGIDSVNLANNHAYDVGEEGYKGTIRALSKPDVRIHYYGNGTTAYVTKNGVKVALLGYVSQKAYLTQMRSQIQAARKKADVVVAHFHWTDKAEFKYARPSARQQFLARYAINCGADLVIGEHTHRISGIERYKGKYIAYDLGNFVTMASNPINQFGPDNEYGKYDYDSMIYRQAFNVWEDGFVEAGDITIIPCAITSQYAQWINNAQPTPYPKGSAEYLRVMKRIRDYSPSPADFDAFPINLN